MGLHQDVAFKIDLLAIKDHSADPLNVDVFQFGVAGNSRDAGIRRGRCGCDAGRARRCVGINVESARSIDPDGVGGLVQFQCACLLYTSPSPRDRG